VWKTLEPSFNDRVPPVLSAPFDAELFGHWWFEGPQWLEEVARILHTQPTGLKPITGSEYLDRHKPMASISMGEGSWGAGGDHQVWLNNETEWTYRELYAAELTVRELCARSQDFDTAPQQALHDRVLQQLCRELLLLESSDWQFLITTGAARDYAEHRFRTHLGQFEDLRTMLLTLSQDDSLNEDQFARLVTIEERDSIFPGLDPALWRQGSKSSLGSALTSINPNDGPKLLDPQPSPHPTPVLDGAATELPKFLPEEA